MSSVTRSNVAGRAVVGVVIFFGLAFLYRAAALFVVHTWRDDPYYTHGAPVFLAALGLAAWRLWRAGGSSDPVPVWSFLGLPLAAGMYFVGLAQADAYLIAWSALVLAAAISLASGGLARLRLLMAPLLLALLAFPTPWTLEACVWLQDRSTAAAAVVLTALGVPITAGLTTISTGNLSFEVTPACSGFQGAVSLLAVGACIATLFPMVPSRRRVVLGLAVPLALLLNVTRLVAVVGIGLGWGADAAEGFFHGFSSALLFVAETLILLLVAGALSRPKPVSP